MNKTKHKYLCGCTIIARTRNRRQVLSIFPACDLADCQVKRMVRLNVITTSQDKRKTDTKIVRLPSSTYRNTSKSNKYYS